MRLTGTLLAILTLASACTAGSSIDRCAGWQPIYPSRGDVMGRRLQEQIVAHNEHGERQCGWEPVRR